MEYETDENMDVDESTSEVENNDTEEEGEQCNSKPGPSDSSESKVYLPGQLLGPNEILEADPTAYIMLHDADAGSPCLSFDIIQDNLGSTRDSFPHTCFIVSGTQAAQKRKNKIIVMKLSNLQKTGKEEGEEEDSSSSSDEEGEDNAPSAKTPRMNSSSILHHGCVNRIRTCNVNDTILAAAWSELGKVNIFDLKKHILSVDKGFTSNVITNKKKKKVVKVPKQEENEKPLYIFNHLQEGYAVDWSTTEPGQLATGDCSSKIHIWKPRESSWFVDKKPLLGHNNSVEDIQWSPSEKTVFASCSVDKSIRIWDIRSTKPCLTLEDAHNSDVNVISWNRIEPLIVSGGDDGYLKIWDLRNFKNDAAVAIFKYHTAPVTTVEWHPTDSSVFASGGEDDQIALWDLSVERDNELNEQEIKEIPPQLLFIHMGQENVKELHWHRQIPGTIISTAASGFNIFKTISV